MKLSKSPFTLEPFGTHTHTHIQHNYYQSDITTNFNYHLTYTILGYKIPHFRDGKSSQHKVSIIILHLMDKVSQKHSNSNNSHYNHLLQPNGFYLYGIYTLAMAYKTKLLWVTHDEWGINLYYMMLLWCRFWKRKLRFSKISFIFVFVWNEGVNLAREKWFIFCEWTMCFVSRKFPLIICNLLIFDRSCGLRYSTLFFR